MDTTGSKIGVPQIPGTTNDTITSGSQYKYKYDNDNHSPV